jgi:hypothetical protein
MGLVQDSFTLGGKVKEAKENVRAAREARKANLELVKSLDYEPMYASQTVPTYQRTQSPVARSYIESFLMGNNPDSIRSGSPNAGVKRQAAQTQQNAMFGTPEQRLQQQRAYEATTPWKVETPTRPVVGEKAKIATSVAENPILAQQDITDPELAAAFKGKNWLANGDQWKSPLASTYANQLMMAYGGDQKAVANALNTMSYKELKAEVRKRAKEAGGWKALQAKYPQWAGG